MTDEDGEQVIDYSDEGRPTQVDCNPPVETPTPVVIVVERIVERIVQVPSQPPQPSVSQPAPQLYTPPVAYVAPTPYVVPATPVPYVPPTIEPYRSPTPTATATITPTASPTAQPYQTPTPVPTSEPAVIPGQPAGPSFFETAGGSIGDVFSGIGSASRTAAELVVGSAPFLAMFGSTMLAVVAPLTAALGTASLYDGVYIRL